MHTYKIQLTDIQYKKMSFIVFRDRENFGKILRDAINSYLDQPDINEYVDSFIESQYKQLVNEPEEALND